MGRPRHIRRLLAVAAAIAVGLALAPATARAAEPGVVVPLIDDVGAIVHRVQASGARHVRVFVSWRTMEATPGTLGPALGTYDDLVNRLRASGVPTYFVVVRTPSWATAGGAADAPPPPALFAAFLGRLASHFRGRVLAYEVWNEPDFPTFWQGGAPPAVYTALLRAAYPAVKASDPAAKVGVGGLVGNDYAYLDRLYRQGAGGSFDFVGVHTDNDCVRDDPRTAQRDVDGRVSRWSFTGYREVHQTMLDHGDDKPIWMTELGWSTTTGRCPVDRSQPAGVSEADQAAFLTRAYACLAADRYVQLGSWFSLSDFGPEETIGNRFGLLERNGSARPAFGAFQRVRGVAPNRSCGAPVDRDGPRISLYAPKTGQRRSGDLFYRAAARDAQGVRTLALLIDGQQIRITGRGRLRGRWHGWRKLPYGPHSVSFRAVDKARNVSRRTVTVTKVAYGFGEAIRTRIALGLYGTGRARLAGGQLYTSPHAARARAGGNLVLRWLRRSGSRWVQLGPTATGPVTRGVRSRRRLRAGRYRVVVAYAGFRTFRRAVAARTFRVG